MTLLEIRDWFAVLAGPSLSVITLGLLTRAKSKIDTLAITVDGRLSALLLSKDVETKAKVAEASAVGEAVGRAGERSDKNAETLGTDHVSNQDLLTAIQALPVEGLKTGDKS